MEMRKVYAETIKQIALQDERVFVLEADLSSAIATSGLKEVLGERYVNLGIMEANMMGVSAGISVSGGICFVHTFGQFATRRAFDQIFVSLAYAQQNVVIVGSDSGVTAEHNGGTHMTFEDTGLMRLVPHAKVYDVSDEVQLKYILEKAYREGGVNYIRMMRKEAVKLYSEGARFDSGATLVKEGKDLTLLANGICVSESLAAAEQLEKEGVSVEVIDCYSVKPLDAETILTSARKTGRVMTCENHNVIGGLGSAVCELLSEKQPTPVMRLGVHEHFGQVGKLAYLKDYYGISADKIVTSIRAFINPEGQ
ncbi:transketolase family protein [Aerococcaceae bacterium NML210727]|nr:transketolase family protein [Aerococcaceae bacterium NML210727]MCW6654517.1 transketolase family protein [Aerococcaceae bacterium NML201296]